MRIRNKDIIMTTILARGGAHALVRGGHRHAAVLHGDLRAASRL